MLVLDEPTMGCGRSKHSSKNSSDDIDQDNKQSQKSIVKTEKSNKISDRKENDEPKQTAVIKSDGSGKREKQTRKQEEKLTLSPLKSSNINSVNNGTVKVAVAQETVKSERFTETRTRTAFKDRPLPGNAQNVLNLTSSQIEFFRMLDEKIEQGNDYYVEESSED